MRLLEACGSPREIGYAIGSAVPELVVESVELVCRLDLPEHELSERLAAVERRLAETFPNVLEEADGLAEGSGISLRDALVLSVASDLHGKLPGWCSLGAVASGDGVLVGKNLDTHEGMAPVQVIERLAWDGALQFTHVTAAGAMWTDGGVNEAGLALVNSSLDAPAPDPNGVPDGILAREILARCPDVPSAIELASRHSMMTLGENILVADAGGRAALIEKLPGSQAIRDGDTIVACNHPVAAGLDRLMASPDPIRANSERRLARLEKTAGRDTEWTVKRLGAVLADHVGGVCQHGADGLWTIASIVIAPRSRRMWVATGPPCSSAHQEITSTVVPGKEAQHVQSEG
jgi:isopenicillin-N N-acyltransferase-like protein